MGRVFCNLAQLSAIIKLAPTDGFQIVTSESEISKHLNVHNQVKFDKSTPLVSSLPSHIQRALMQSLLLIFNSPGTSSKVDTEDSTET